MRYGNLELHNVAELLSGSAREVLPPEAWAWLAANPIYNRPPWEEQTSPDGLWLSRIPDALRRKLNPLVQINGLLASGAEARFNLKSASATLTLKCVRGQGVLEIWHGPFMTSWKVIGTEPVAVKIEPPANLDELAALARRHRLPFDARLTRVLLPWEPQVRLLGVEGEFEPPRPEQTPRRRYLAYGSSITNGARSIPPTASYAARTAQLLGVDLLNLGFGGGAHLEKEIAEHIAARDDWDFASLEMGINIGGIGRAEFARRVDVMVDTVHAAHPDKRLFCIDVFTCRDDLTGNPHFNEYRDVVRDKVCAVNRPNVVWIPGRQILSSVEGLTADLVHPSPAGMEEMARNLSRAMNPHLFPK